jgi:hypothetical protein
LAATDKPELNSRNDTQKTASKTTCFRGGLVLW